MITIIINSCIGVLMGDQKSLNNIINLSNLGRGETAIIIGVHGSDSIRHRLQAMGLRTGREAEVIRCSRLGPMQIRIGSVNLIMRRSDAARVSISS